MVTHGTGVQQHNCHEARAYVETCKINGVDDFVTGISPLLEVQLMMRMMTFEVIAVSIVV